MLSRSARTCVGARFANGLLGTLQRNQKEAHIGGRGHHARRRVTTGVKTSAVSALLLVLASCADATELARLPTNTLARVELDNGVWIDFVKAGRTVVVSEHAPLDVPSPVAYFISAESATPLELFLAIAENSAVPAELVQMHDELTLAAGASPTPRKLRLPSTGYRTTYESYGAADCSYTADHDWYVDQWTALGWNTKWYHSGDKTTTGAFLEKFTPWVTTQNFFTHVCNYSVEDDYDANMLHDLYRDGNHLTGDTVELGYRHTYWSTLASALSHKARAYLVPSATGKFRLGSIAP
jgi:hypothetical protein